MAKFTLITAEVKTTSPTASQHANEPYLIGTLKNMKSLASRAQPTLVIFNPTIVNLYKEALTKTNGNWNEVINQNLLGPEFYTFDGRLEIYVAPKPFYRKRIFNGQITEELRIDETTKEPIEYTMLKVFVIYEYEELTGKMEPVDGNSAQILGEQLMHRTCVPVPDTTSNEIDDLPQMDDVADNTSEQLPPVQNPQQGQGTAYTGYRR